MKAEARERERDVLSLITGKCPECGNRYIKDG